MVNSLPLNSIRRLMTSRKYSWLSVIDQIYARIYVGYLVRESCFLTLLETVAPEYRLLDLATPLFLSL